MAHHIIANCIYLLRPNNNCVHHKHRRHWWSPFRWLGVPVSCVHCWPPATCEDQVCRPRPLPPSGTRAAHLNAITVSFSDGKTVTRPAAPIIKTLRAVRAKIARPECWTQKASARNASGYPVSIDDPEAVCWCLAGALGCVLYMERDAKTEAMALLQCDERVEGRVVAFNDDPNITHADVLAVLDRTIAKAEGRV
jgi:hypothetical protein